MVPSGDRLEVDGAGITHGKTGIAVASAYYLCSACLEGDGVVTRLFRVTMAGSGRECKSVEPPAFHCPADPNHSSSKWPPILITQAPRHLAMVTWSPMISRERRRELEGLAEQLQRALAEIFEALRAIGERRDAGEGLEWTYDQRQALGRIPSGWRLYGFS